MKKRAHELEKEDKIILGGRTLTVKEIELSDIGKQGKRKCRIEAQDDSGEKMVIVRPEDYPIDIEE